MRRLLLISVLSVLLVPAAKGLGFESEEPRSGPAPDVGRSDVGGAFGEDGGRVTSQMNGTDGVKVLHGVQLILGPRNWLKEYAVYNTGSFGTAKPSLTRMARSSVFNGANTPGMATT